VFVRVGAAGEHRYSCDAVGEQNHVPVLVGFDGKMIARKPLSAMCVRRSSRALR
jgi:hypothetical protein